MVIPLNFADRYQAYTILNHTCSAFGVACLPPLGPAYNDVTLIYQGDTSIVVRAMLTNSITSLGGVLPTPSIDMTFTLKKWSDGSWHVPIGQRDAFPALGIWEWDPNTGGRTLLQLRDATIPEALTGLAPIFSQDRWCNCFHQ
jgi:hypothetical protein